MNFLHSETLTITKSAHNGRSWKTPRDNAYVEQAERAKITNGKFIK
jgi:hypothetical protein